MFAPRTVAQLCRTSAPALRARSRTYATGPGASGSSNLPMGLALAGLAGLGGYVYLSRNPDATHAVANKMEEAGATAKAAVGANDSETGKALVKDAWTPFTLTKVEPYNHNSKVYHFTFDNPNAIAGGDVASALLVRSPEGEGEVKDDKGKPVIRPYTQISPQNEKGGLTLLIKEYKDGKLTSYISGMKPGESQLLFKGPIPKYKYSPNTFDRGLCISGGSGITPMKQLISHSLSLPEDKTKWTLIFANVTEEDILLRKDWDALARAHPDRLTIKYTLDKPPRGWKGETGFVDASMIERSFGKKPDGEKVMAFVCGPPPMYAGVSGKKDGPRQGPLSGALADLGYTSEEVYKF